MKYVGVDISKDSFDGYHEQLGSRKFSNDAGGFRTFRKWIGSAAHIVMEASGPYYLGLAHDLYNEKIPVSIINPLVIRRFCQMNLQRTKTDSKDAMAISRFGELTHPATWTPAPAHVRELLQIQSVMEQLSKQLTSTKNALGSLNEHPDISRDAINALQKVMLIQQQQIAQLEKQLIGLTKQHYASEFQSLTSIPGVGNKTAILLILATNGFTRFNNIKQLTAYTGLAPRIFQSGKTINKKPKISKLGMSDLRRSLFMCSLQAIKYNTACKCLFERLKQKGKATKVALMAVCHKLLRQAFAIATQKIQFKSEYSLVQ